MVEYSDNFLKEAKKLSKKFKLLKSDLKVALQEIQDENLLGTALGYDLYKKRVKNSSIPTGKSGGFRIIVYQKVENTIILISIYSKTQTDSLSDDMLRTLVKAYFSETQ